MLKCICLLLSFFFSITSDAQIENTSYVNKSHERVLQFSFVVPVEITEAWKYFTIDSKLSEWIAPVAHIELKSGGSIVTNYDKTKPLTDSSSIKLGIISYLEDELLILKVNLNNNFSSKVQEEDQNLQEIIQFIPGGPGKTRIISSMIGWGEGKDWDNTYDFFVRGNEWTYNELLKRFK